jgi:E3 ubiquitin-protein ligase HUWE1
MSPPELEFLETFEKVAYFKAMIDKNTPAASIPPNYLEVDRENIVSDSMRQFKQFKNLRSRMNIKFVEEQGVDRGGLSREFFYSIFKELLSESLMLFSVANTEQISYKVNEASHEIQGINDLMFFFGQLLGKAFFERIPVGISFNLQILNALLGLQPNYSN